MSCALGELERESKCKAAHASEVRRAEKDALEATERQLRRFVRVPETEETGSFEGTETYQQANLWLEQCRALADVLREQRECDPPSRTVTTVLNNTMLCASAAAVLGGIAQSFAQACEDGKRAAVETIKELSSRLSQDPSSEAG